MLELVALIAVRKLLDYVFTQSDLFWLDHLLPEAHRRAREDETLDASAVLQVEHIVCKTVRLSVINYMFNLLLYKYN